MPLAFVRVDGRQWRVVLDYCPICRAHIPTQDDGNYHFELHGREPFMTALREEARRQNNIPDPVEQPVFDVDFS